jgi:gliding motility-associated-like protein
MATPIITTTYTVIVSSGSCKDTTNITITVNPLPTASITAIPSVLICVGNNTTLTASGGGTYIWSTTSTAASIVVSPTIATNYIVTVTNANGCTKSDAVNVNVLQQVAASILGTSNICEGSSTVLTAQGGSIFTWSPGGATTSVITVSPSANTCYSVTVSNGACSDDTSICVTVVPASTFTVNAGPDQTINVGQQTTLNNTSSSSTYNWSPVTGLSCSTCANPVANPTVTTTYTLTTTVGSCMSNDSVTIYVEMNCGEVFVPNTFSPNGDGKNDFISIRSSCIKTMNFVIYDRWGNRVFESTDVTIVNDPKNGWDGYYHGKLMDAAVFFYTLNVEMINNETKVYKGNITLVR